MTTKPEGGRLKAFSTDELLAEIVRRRNATIARRPIVKCEECQHFTPCGDDMTDAQVDAYNACSKGHKMSFRMCEEDYGQPDGNGDWGFYRNPCADRIQA